MTTAEAYELGYADAYRGRTYRADMDFAGIISDPVKLAYADGFDAGACDRPSLDELTFDVAAEGGNW